LCLETAVGQVSRSLDSSDCALEPIPAVLATFELKARLDLVLDLLNQRIEVLEESRQIDERI
jgi:hypothetical protein